MIRHTRLTKENYVCPHSYFRNSLFSLTQSTTRNLPTMTAEQRQKPNQKETSCLTKEETTKRNSLLKWMEDNGEYDR
jgi:hypothetical protein